MIKLSDVSTEILITFLKYDCTEQGISALSTLEKHQIRDFQTLKNMVENGRKEFRNEIFQNAILEVEANVAHAEKQGREPIIFNCNNYEGATVFSKTLKYTDKHNNCDVLIFKNPTISCTGKYNMLNDVTINEAKNLLSKVTAYDKPSTGNNAFIEKFRRFTITDAANVRDAINFYEEQVLRQAYEANKRGVNLFSLNKTQKDLIVRKNVENIVKYLVENADNYVWGKLSSIQKNKLVTAVTKCSGYENQLIRERMIELITNYTTLKELQSDKVKEKVLNRFIIK